MEYSGIAIAKAEESHRVISLPYHTDAFDNKPNSLNFTFDIIMSFVFNVKTSMANDVKWFMFPSFIWWLRRTDLKHRRLLDGDYTLIIAYVYSFDAPHLSSSLSVAPSLWHFVSGRVHT